MAADANNTMSLEDDIDFDFLKKYIAYCKSKCAPRLGPEAAKKLSDYYVSVRGQVHAMEMNSSERSSIPITVRQLEAIIRIAESIAKMALAPVATVAHVDEAIRLFKVSTMNAVQTGHSGDHRTAYTKHSCCVD